MLNACCAKRSCHDGPTVVQAVVDPNEPPMPGKATSEQALQVRQGTRSRAEGRDEDHQDDLEDQIREVV